MSEEAAAAIAVGSNIEPRSNLPAALERLRAAVEVRRVSRVYPTQPAGGADGPPYLNAAVLLCTDLPPRRLRDELLRPIEELLGRRRSADRNAPRPIDLDLVLYGGRRIAEPGLELPDPEIAERPHLALPLADLVPDWVHPASGLTLAAIAAPFAGRCRPIELPGWE